LANSHAARPPAISFTFIMTNPAEEAKLANYGAFLRDVAADTLPAVSFVRPFEALAGHPADSTSDQYEQFLADLIAKVQADPRAVGLDRDLHHHRRGRRLLRLGLHPGGRLLRRRHPHPDDRGLTVRPTGLRRPHLLRPRLSPEVHRAQLEPAGRLGAQSRQPAQPIAARHAPYVPVNGPAIGDLMQLFQFDRHDGRDDDDDRDDDDRD